MQSLELHPDATKSTDLGEEVARLETELAARRAELTSLQEEFRAFKARYTATVGSRLAELSEIERAIKEAEARLLGVAAEEDEAEIQVEEAALPSAPVGLRKLFWSVAKLFHPDHAGDEREARRRHTVMAEASRAYREGDIDSLHALLGDEELQFFCTTNAHTHEETEDLAPRLIQLKEELRTVRFGIKRLTQDALYQLQQRVAEEATHGRDALAQQAERINRQIIKAKYRLENLSE
ncbi:MAG: hypothetical protein JO360_11295 [Acidobacteria bacterium]|nr:hypothetical protein [Acidobacteriota bacterium]